MKSQPPATDNPRPVRSALRRRNVRRGHAMVEFAVVAPVLFSILLGCIEVSRLNMIRNTLATAAYEGCRAGIVPGATTTQVNTTVSSVLSASLISGQTVTINPSPLSNSASSVSVTISVPISSNGWIFSRFFTGTTLQSSCTLAREVTS